MDRKALKEFKIWFKEECVSDSQRWTGTDPTKFNRREVRLASVMEEVELRDCKLEARALLAETNDYRAALALYRQGGR